MLNLSLDLNLKYIFWNTTGILLILVMSNKLSMIICATRTDRLRLKYIFGIEHFTLNDFTPRH